MTWNVTKAVEHLTEHAHSASKRKCATYTRQAIAAGGITVANTASAKDYGPNLVSAGFAPLAFSPATYMRGDVVVIKAIAGHPDGHMAMFDGQRWISDFVQGGLYPGSGYRKAQPGFSVYRHPDASSDANTK